MTKANQTRLSWLSSLFYVYLPDCRAHQLPTNCLLDKISNSIYIGEDSARQQQGEIRLSFTNWGIESHMACWLMWEKKGEKNPQAEQIKDESRLRLGYRGFPPTGQSFTGRGVGTRRRAFTAAAGDGTVVNKRNVSNTAIRLDKRGGGFHRAKNRTADMITKLMSNEHMKRMLSASEH